MTEEEGRAAIVAEAQSWIGTPYVSNGMVKGKRGGTDCAMFILAVYADLGFVPKEFDPRPYPPMWHIHRNEEKYLEAVLHFVNEVEGPPKPGDLALFKIGLVFAHGAIVTNWPMMIHAVGNDRVLPCDVSKQTIGKRALARVPQRFFSWWSE